jgi:hypothetical protein
VDAYELKDGTPFSWDNPVHVSNIYYDAEGKQTRDPRLYLNILTNGATWLKQTVETFEGGKNKILDGSTKTGYYLRKYMNPSVLTLTNPISWNIITYCSAMRKSC